MKLDVWRLTENKFIVSQIHNKYAFLVFNVHKWKWTLRVQSYMHLPRTKTHWACSAIPAGNFPLCPHFEAKHQIPTFKSHMHYSIKLLYLCFQAHCAWFVLSYGDRELPYTRLDQPVLATLAIAHQGFRSVWWKAKNSGRIFCNLVGLFILNFTQWPAQLLTCT